MEFNEKLQELRKREGLTQEQLAEALFVSRAAVSKWESGRGWPSIDSLREISRYFSVSLDDLLSSENLLALAEGESKRAREHSMTKTFGLMDCAMLMLAILPVFSLKDGTAVLSVPLFSLLGARPELFALCATLIAAMAVFGVVTLAAKTRGEDSRVARRRIASQALTCLCILMFIATQQIYAAALAFAFLAIKMFLLMRSL